MKAALGVRLDALFFFPELFFALDFFADDFLAEDFFFAELFFLVAIASPGWFDRAAVFHADALSRHARQSIVTNANCKREKRSFS
jgi:hypothetical protein